MKSIIFVLLMGLATITLGCDGDPYRIGIYLNDQRTVEVLFARCTPEVQVKRVALAISSQKESPIWELTIDSPIGEKASRFSPDNTPPGWVVSTNVGTAGEGGQYVVVVDSSDLKGQTYSFGFSELRQHQVLAGNNDYYGLDQFAEELCN